MHHIDDVAAGRSVICSPSTQRCVRLDSVLGKLNAFVTCFDFGCCDGLLFIKTCLKSIRRSGDDAALPLVLWDPADEYPEPLSLLVVNGNRFFLLPLSYGEENGELHDRSVDLSLSIHKSTQPNPGLRNKPSRMGW